MTGGVDLDRNGRLARALAPYLASDAGGAGTLLAVSGGPDSMALLHAAAAFAGDAPIHVATVDHRLRPEAAAEAKAVGAYARQLGLPHRILRWTDPHRGSGIQAAARQARYALLSAHARQLGATRILTAHTADDQAETLLMRLLAGSGPAGLVGMARARSLRNGVVLARPFLHLRKEELVEHCRHHAVPFHLDPSNSDPRYGRARLRTMVPALAREGLTPDKLIRLAERLARDAEVIAQASDALFARVATVDERGGVTLDGQRLRGQPAALVLRVVDRALDAAAPQTDDEAFKRLDKLERLVLEALLPALHQGRRLRRTLRGVLVDLSAGGTVRLAPAPPRREPSRGGLVAGGADLLGKGEAPAYIGGERVE